MEANDDDQDWALTEFPHQKREDTRAVASHSEPEDVDFSMIITLWEQEGEVDGSIRTDRARAQPRLAARYSQSSGS